MSVFRVILTASMFGITVQNVFHVDGGDASPSLDQVALTIEGQWLDQWRGFSHQLVVWNDIAVVEVAPPTGLTFHRSTNLPGNGNAAASTDIPVCAHLVKLQTATPGPKGRGRMYVPGPSQAGANLGVLLPGTITLLNNRLATLMQRFGGQNPSSGLRLVVCGRGNPSDVKPVVNMVVKSTYGTQRRRNYGVGV